MELSNEQEQAVKAALYWFNNETGSKPYFYLAGRAGRGKTFCITAITQHIKGLVQYVAPTARAALIMRQKGCPNPRTIHNLIYKPAGQTGNKEQIDLLQELRDLEGGSARAQEIKGILIAQFKQELPEIDKRQALATSDEERRKGEWRKGVLKVALSTNLSNYKDLTSSSPLFDLNMDSEIRKASLVVVDEVSMCDSEMVDDLLSFKVPLLIQGDKGQLPPVFGKSFIQDKTPDFELYQVHRQAKDSPIIYLADLAADGKRLPLGWHGDCLVTRESEPELAIQANQIIVGRHVTRHNTNSKVRALKGYTGDLPNIGERVMCRHNDLKKMLYNNDQYEVTFFRDGAKECRIGIKNDVVDTIVSAHKDYFYKREPNPFMKSKAACIDWAYCTTAQGAQGGGWPFVYVYDESKYFPYAKEWLYTSITRSSERVVVRV